MKLPTGQKAKMLAGELYLATDPQLVAEDQRAQELLFYARGEESPARAA
jgi:hypothetical protein